MRRFHISLTIATATVAASGASPAGAQGWFAPGYFDNWAFNNYAADALRRSQKQILRGDAAETLRRPAPEPSIPVVPPPPPVRAETVRRVADQLAAGAPGAAREKASQAFVELYARYGQLERRLGVPRGDPAGAMAALVAVSYMAYADADLPDAQFATLYRQFRAAAGTPGVGNDTAEAQVTMAILASWLAATRIALDARPDPKRSSDMREAGGTYLRALLGVDPSRVRLGADGLTLTP